MDEACAGALSTVLRKNHVLRHVTFQSVPIDSNGAVALFQALSSIRSLRSFAIYSEHLDDIDAATLAELLRSNSCLHKLKLGSKHVSERSLRDLSCALATQTAQGRLQAFDCTAPMNAACLLEFARALESNKSLRRLCLWNATMHPVVEAAFAKALRDHNRTLEELGAVAPGGSVSFPFQRVKSLFPYCQRNVVLNKAVDVTERWMLGGLHLSLLPYVLRNVAAVSTAVVNRRWVSTITLFTVLRDQIDNQDLWESIRTKIGPATVRCIPIRELFSFLCRPRRR